MSVPTHSPDPHALRSLKLLIVEDDALVAMLAEDALTLRGHRIIGVADTIADALAIADADRPDLALCDVRLSAGESGIMAAEALAARGIPCVFLSATCPVASTHPLILGCVAKPFHAAVLGDAVWAAYQHAGGRTPRALPSALKFY